MRQVKSINQPLTCCVLVAGAAVSSLDSSLCSHRPGLTQSLQTAALSPVSAAGTRVTEPAPGAGAQAALTDEGVKSSKHDFDGHNYQHVPLLFPLLHG